MWEGIHGHDDVARRFARMLSAGRLASTFLFVGPAGIGKRSFALRLARALLCQRREGAELRGCGDCESCRLFDAGNHPDLLSVSRPEGKSFIPLDLLIGSKDRRMREGLCHDVALKPFLGGRRVAIIDDADYLNPEGANALLKTLEEPPPHSLIILIGTGTSRQLPTIRSRCQIVRFEPLSSSTVVQLSQQFGLADSEEAAWRLAELSGGSLETAAVMADQRLLTFRQELLEHFGSGNLDSVGIAGQVSALLDDAGKDAASKRQRLRHVMRFTAEYFHALLRHQSGAPVEADRELQTAINQAAPRWQLSDEQSALCIERTLEALSQIDRNANLSTLLQCWLDDLEELTSQPVF